MQTWLETGDTGGVMRFDTIIRNGTIVTATDTYAGDVGVTNGLITAIGKDLPIENADKIIDAKDGLVIPGGIDVHTHLVCRLLLEKKKERAGLMRCRGG